MKARPLLVVLGLMLSGASCATPTNTNTPTQGSTVNISAAPKTTPYQNGAISITNDFPERVNFSSVSFDLQTTPDGATHVVVIHNGLEIERHTITEKGIVSFSVPLISGENKIGFRLGLISGPTGDTEAAATVQYIDSPPTLYTSCNKITGKPLLVPSTGEWACVTGGDVSGPAYGTAYMPVYGRVSPHIVDVRFANRKLYPASDGFINERVPVRVALGTNIYDITVTDDVGNKSTTRYNLEWESTESSNLPDDTYDSPSGCCKICTTGKACGNSCISRSYTCHQPPGCACDG